MFHRIKKAFGANIYGQAVNVFIQVLSLPLYLKAWGAEKYGVWLMLSAIPAYIAMADAGIVSVAANKMTMQSAGGDKASANSTFQSALLMTSLLVCIFFCLGGGVFYTINAEFLREEGSRLAAIMLVVVAMLTIFSGLMEAVYRAGGAYAEGLYALNHIRLIEWGCGMLALFADTSILSCALGMLVGRLVSTLFLFQRARARFSQFKWSYRGASLSEAKAMLKPAISFLAFPAGNALSIQGISLVVGAALGGPALVAFTAYRTLARIMVQAVTIISRSVWAEISILYGKGDRNGVLTLCRKSTIVSLLASFCLFVSLWILGPAVIKIWSRNQISYMQGPFLILMFCSVLTSVWQIKMVALMATNNHVEFSLIYLVSAILAVGGGVILADAGLTAVAIVLFGLEISMIIASRRIFREIMG